MSSMGPVVSVLCRSARGGALIVPDNHSAKYFRSSNRSCELPLWAVKDALGFRSVRGTGVELKKKGEGEVGLVAAVATGDFKEEFEITGINGEKKTYRAVTPWVAARDYLKEMFESDCGSVCSRHDAEPKAITVKSPSGSVVEYTIAATMSVSFDVCMTQRQ